MTVTSQTAKVTTTGNSSARTFSFSPIVIFASTDIQVTTTVVATGVETTLSEGTSSTTYSVGITTYPATGSIQYPHTGGTLLPSTQTITVKRVLTLEQQTDLNNQGAYSPSTQEEQFDKLVMIDIQQQDELDRAFKLPVSYAGSLSVAIPSDAAASAGNVLAINSGKTALEWTTPNTSAYITVPSAPTDNSVPRMDGTTGTTFQTSGVTINDNDLVQAPGGYGSTQGTDVASATTVIVPTDGQYFDLTGNTGPVGTFTVDAGRYFEVQCDSTPTFTHHATNLDLPGEADFTAAAGDILKFSRTRQTKCNALASQKPTEPQLQEGRLHRLSLLKLGL